MQRAFLLGFLLLVSCTKPRLVGADEAVIASPTEIDFGWVALGTTAERKVQLTNTGRGEARIELSTDAPFEVDPRSVSVEGGGIRELTIRFSPSSEDPSEGQITLRDHVLIRLRGIGVDVSRHCGATVCESVALESDGGCTRSPLESGTVCSTSCIANGSCQSGLCVGAMSSCDDGNLCTDDACGPEGCLHLPHQCVSNDPCLAPSCDPVLGCTMTPAPDGTRCGSFDCTTSHICVSGVCQTSPTPAGGACQASPCSEGICVNDVCIPKSTRMLTPEWIHSGNPSSSFVGLGSDTTGNIFVHRSVDVGNRFWPALESVARDGGTVWSRPLPATFLNWDEKGALIDGVLVLVDGATAKLVGVDPDGGMPLWSRALRADIDPSGQLGQWSMWVPTQVGRGPGTIVVPIVLSYGDVIFANEYAYVARVDVRSGQLVALTPAVIQSPFYADRAFATGESGIAFVGYVEEDGGYVTEAIDLDGGIRWDAEGAGVPRGAAHGLVIGSNGSRMEAFSGAIDPLAVPVNQLAITAGTLWAWDRTNPNSWVVNSFDITTGAPLSTANADLPVGTSEAGALLSINRRWWSDGGTFVCDADLVSALPDGGGWTCPLDVHHEWVSEGTLLDEQLALHGRPCFSNRVRPGDESIMSFGLPGQSQAPGDWTGPTFLHPESSPR